jgi:hypothetical protein
MTPSPFAGTRVALATLHGKQVAIAPPFAAHLGAQVIAVPLDTDALGTFSGEVPRPGSMRETATEKARRGATALGLRYGLASEGTFGPHPAVPLIAAGHEMLLLLDLESGRIIEEAMIAPATNFAHLALPADAAKLDDFLARIGFPAHAVIVRPDGPDALPNAKGLTDRAALDDVIARLSEGGRKLRVETDMRAHMNPTRMAAIGELADRLARRLAVPCPSCHAPGFGRVDVVRGLPCAECGTPTGLVKAEIFACTDCGHQDSRPRADGLTEADPAYCPACNP